MSYNYFMLCEMSVRAFAKINLGLRVLPKRQDGFHNIESIFQTVNLYDELKISLESGYGDCEVYCDDMELPLDNTIKKAYKAFREVTELNLNSVKVCVKKGVPVGGGLGGGSSDAAAFVHALEKMTGLELSEVQLDSIASRVGSDVFFFMHCGDYESGAAVVLGRGEIVRKIKKRLDLHFVFVFPNIHSSTKEAYALVDEQLHNGSDLVYPNINELEALYKGHIREWNFINTFTVSMVKKYSEIGTCITKLKEEGSLFCDMSGSGSTVFGIFSSDMESKNVAKKLSTQGFNAVAIN